MRSSLRVGVLLITVAAIVSCVDSWAVRVTLARMARLLGVPLFDAGFFEADGYVTAYPNTSEDEPCARCQYDPPKPGRASCSMYAREQVERGFVPTSQTVAGTFGALLAETVVRGLHGEFPLAGRQLLLNVRTGRSRVTCCTGSRIQRCGGRWPSSWSAPASRA